MILRRATERDIPALAEMWHATWREAHEAHVPEALTRLRTIETFRDRLAAFGDHLRMSGTATTPLGMCVVKGAELDQLFVSRQARGTGLAEALLRDGEARLARSGVTDAFLYCAEGNSRAVHFYEKHGWRNDGPYLAPLETTEGLFELECLIFRKMLVLPR